MLKRNFSIQKYGIQDTLNLNIATNKETIKRWNINILPIFICFYAQNENVVFSMILGIKKSKNDFICDKNVTKNKVYV